ncbi:hypothetical protein EG342_05880 [Chryseobacterium lactis]|uniref:Bacteriocin n=2 Tax=Chryseobacterium lactis TaxID=1241981 RepID=A0ABM7AUX8_CHRLC|nr:hypothetical protein EG342_05880 [Chryseobacterium lactis]
MFERILSRSFYRRDDSRTYWKRWILLLIKKIKLNTTQFKLLTMKKSTIPTKRLTKKEMKEISGARPFCPLVVSCFDPSTGQEMYGVHGIQDGPCC